MGAITTPADQPATHADTEINVACAADQAHRTAIMSFTSDREDSRMWMGNNIHADDMPCVNAIAIQEFRASFLSRPGWRQAHAWDHMLTSSGHGGRMTKAQWFDQEAEKQEEGEKKAERERKYDVVDITFRTRGPLGLFFVPEKVPMTLDRDHERLKRGDEIVNRIVPFDNEEKIIGINLSSANSVNTTNLTYTFAESIPAGYNYGLKTLSDYVISMKYVFTKEGASQLGGFGTIGKIFPAKWNWKAFWKTLRQKLKLLVTSNFTFCHNVFYTIKRCPLHAFCYYMHARI